MSNRPPLWVLAIVLGCAAAGATLMSRSLAARSAADAERVAAVVAPTDDYSTPEPFERRPGGATTVFVSPNRDAFSQSSANMTFERELDFKVGNGIFKKVWVSAPSSTTASDGLGPLFNTRSCQRCHLKDGRGHPPADGEPPASMLFRLSVPARDEAEHDLIATHRAGSLPDPTYGGQLQTFAIQGHSAEGSVAIAYQEETVELAGGETATLRRPTYELTDLAYGPADPEIMVSPRIAPPMIGMGLLEAIPDGDILANADPDDADGDGVSGRPSWVWSDLDQRVGLGRFGWKAGTPSVTDQVAAAFLGDIGIGTPLHPKGAGECMPAQDTCMSAPHGAEDGIEAPQEMLDLVVFYSRNLAVPARRDLDDPDVLAGKALFYQSGCIACHRPKFVTRKDSDEPEQSFQLIWPYTDLLLHDMGEGLADNRPDGVASGSEWRTAPLWGIGLTRAVSPQVNYLHDGRARTVLEAILWHGGEAQAARDTVVAMTPAERAQLLAFLDSL